MEISAKNQIRGKVTSVIHGTSYSIYTNDLLQGYIDPEGSDLIIGDVWTEYGYLSFDNYGNGVFPISEDISLLVYKQTD